jgi:hypothetical protein
LGKSSLVKCIKESIWFCLMDNIISAISYSILQANNR